MGEGSKPAWTTAARAIGLALALAAAGPSARAAEPATALIVFDGSGSMWGTLDGDKRHKFDLARDGVRAALTTVPPTARYGLMSYGHRRAADCNDVQLLAPLAAGDSAPVIQNLERLNPRGKGPITNTLREAARALDGVANASIVLIHDNSDNCRMDPCVVVEEWRTSRPGLKVHMVPIALEPEDVERVRCIATATGGSIHLAREPAEVAPAIAAAVRIALVDPRGTAPPAGAPSPSTAAGGTAAGGTPAERTAGPAPAAVIPGPGLALTAKLGRDAPALDVPVRWRIRRGTTVVREAAAATLIAPLDPGAYVVEAAYGLARAEAKVDVTPGPAVVVPLSLEAGAVTITVQDLANAPPATGARITVRQASAAPGSAPVWIGRAADADLVLPAGAYVVAVADSLVAIDERLDIAAGSTTARTLLTRAGRLEITPVAVAGAAGTPLDGATVLVAHDDPDAPDGRREIARSAAPRPTFVVPAGTYYVTVVSGAASVRERVAVGAGDTVKQTIPLGLARLTLTLPTLPARAALTAVAVRPPVRTRVLSLAGEPREVTRSSSAAPELTLAAGRYRIEATAGVHNVRATQDVDLEPGADRKVTLRLDAAVVALRLAGSPSADVAWEVRDSRGQRVTRSFDPSPRLVLAPGRYTAQVEIRGKRAETTFEAVADGQQQTVEIVPP